MRPVAEAVVEAGLIDESVLKEMKRWGMTVEAEPDEKLLGDMEATLQHIREAIESQEQVRIDETDLDLLCRFLDKEHKQSGRLIVKEGKRHQTMKVEFCRTHAGEYAIPWSDEETPYVLANGETHLKWEAEGVQHDIYFMEVREVFFGKKKAFAVCTPSKGQPNE